MRVAARSRLLAALLACGLALLFAAGAPAGTVDPTPEQVRALVAGDPDEPLALMRLLRGRSKQDFDRYLRGLDQEVRTRGGVRVYGGTLAPPLVGGARGYDTLVIDVFPSRRACVESLRAVDPMVVALGLEDAFVLVLRPWGTGFRLGAGALASLLGAFPREVAADPPPLPSYESEPGLSGGPEISPDAAAAAAFMQADQDAPLAMLNLNLFHEKTPTAAGYLAESGEAAYERYGRSALWHVMRRGGRLLFAGEPIGIAVGAPGSPLDRSWDQLALVYYPSRRHMRDMLADPDYRAALPYRVSGLAFAAALPGQPWPDFAPGSPSASE